MAVTLHHPLIPGLTRTVPDAAADAWTAAGWVLQAPPEGYEDHAPVQAVRTATGGVEYRATFDGGATELLGLTTQGAVDGALTARDRNQAIAGAPLYVYGHSYTTGVGVTDPLDKWTSIFQRVYMASTTQLNRGMSGSTMEQVLRDAWVHWQRKWEPARGVIVVESVLNNVLRTDHNAEDNTVASFRNALTTLLRILRAGAIVTNTHSSITYTGAWADQAYETARTGTFKGSQTAGDTITITGYTDTSIGIMTWANKIGPTLEAQFDVLVNGVKFGPTHDMSSKWQGESDFHTNGVAETYCTWLDGLPTGTKEIKIQVLPSTGGTAKRLFFDGYLKPQPTPPTILVVKDTPITTYSGAPVGNDNAHVLLHRLNNVIDEVVGGYARPSEVIAADAGIGFHPATMLGGVSGGDALHPNVLGHAAIAAAVNRAAQSIPYRRANFN